MYQSFRLAYRDLTVTGLTVPRWYCEVDEPVQFSHQYTHSKGGNGFTEPSVTCLKIKREFPRNVVKKERAGDARLRDLSNHSKLIAL